MSELLTTVGPLRPVPVGGVPACLTTDAGVVCLARRIASGNGGTDGQTSLVSVPSYGAGSYGVPVLDVTDYKPTDIGTALLLLALYTLPVLMVFVGIVVALSETLTKPKPGIMRRRAKPQLRVLPGGKTPAPRKKEDERA